MEKEKKLGGSRARMRGLKMRMKIKNVNFSKCVIVIGLMLAATTGLMCAAVAGLSGSMIIAGNGPELPIVERLARAFEKASPERP